MTKKRWMNEKCEEMEDIMAKHNLFNMHKKVKEISGIFKKRVPPVLVDSNEKIIVDEEDIDTEWQKYIRVLFNNDRDDMALCQHCRERPEIIRSEVDPKTQFLLFGRTCYKKCKNQRGYCTKRNTHRVNKTDRWRKFKNNR